jgi:hypothetical protein
LWFIPVIPGLRRSKQEELYTFQDSPGLHGETLSLNKQIDKQHSTVLTDEIEIQLIN